MDILSNYIIASKILNRLSVEKNRLWKYLPLGKIIDRQIKKTSQSINKAFLQSKLELLIGDFSIIAINDIEKKHVIKWADQTLEHKFDYLGSGLIEVNPLDWHTDFKTGFKWNNGLFYRNYIQVDYSNNADVKVPRELSRCHHLLWLGEAYLITKNEKYANEIVWQIENWIDENPLMYSINWCCSMDVAIRAVNWIYAVNMIMSSVIISDIFVKKLYRSLGEHGFFIFNNLEKDFPSSNNHYAADISGLLYISQILIDTKRGQKWWKFSISEFFMEIQDQVLPSGVHFERSTSYHRLMVELFAYPYFMLRRIKYNVPIDIIYRIESMFDFVYNYTKFNGLSPVIADNDDGRLLPFYKYDFRDHRYLLSLAAVVYQNGQYKSESCGYCIDCNFLLGIQSLKTFNAITVLNKPLLSIIYKDAGFAILRSSDFFLFVNNGGLSRYPELDKIILSKKKLGVHTHDDLLSFELAVGKDDIIVDPGAFVYTSSSADRNEFRATAKHNTIVIDNNNQNELFSSSVFQVRDCCKPLYLEYIPKNDDIDELVGCYHMAGKYDSLLEHKRTFCLNKTSDLLYIKDLIEVAGEHTAAIYFHLAPELTVSLFENGAIISNGKSLKVYFDFTCENKFKIEIVEDTVSPSYGVKFKSKTLKISLTFKSQLNFETLIKWIK